MKNILLALGLVGASTALMVAPLDADAKRLDTGKTTGLLSPLPTDSARNQALLSPSAGQTAQPAAPVHHPAVALASDTRGSSRTAPADHSRLGPLAGLAAGVGLAALASQLGLGEAFGSMLLLALLGLTGLVALIWLMRRHAQPKPAQHRPQPATDLRTEPVTAPRWTPPPAAQDGASRWSASTQPASHVIGPRRAAATGGLSGGLAQGYGPPSDFDSVAFARTARLVFLRVQAANDAARLDDLRRYTTPELYASLQLDLRERGQPPRQTAVEELHASVVEVQQELEQWVVTVRFHGQAREGGPSAEPFDEVWHFVRPLKGQRDWAVAGIQQLLRL